MSKYAIGPTDAVQQFARFETKPDDETKEGNDSGGGYERWRSWEYRPETARKGKEDVFVSHHRLLAIVACYPDDMPIGEILEHLRGKDVHHNAPEADGSCGIKWDNRPECLHVREHGSHSSITQAEMRAWAESDKRDAFDREPVDEDRCARCDAVADVLGTSPAWPGEQRCLDCATETADGETIEL